MNKSILGTELEAEKQRVFGRRFAAIQAQANMITNYRDRKTLSGLRRQIREAEGNFLPSDKDGTELALIESRMGGGPDLDALLERLLIDANDALENPDFGSKKRGRLSRLVRLSSERRLNRSEIMDMQYLVIIAETDDEYPDR